MYKTIRFSVEVGETTSNEFRLTSIVGPGVGIPTLGRFRAYGLPGAQDLGDVAGVVIAACSGNRSIPNHPAQYDEYRPVQDMTGNPIFIPLSLDYDTQSAIDLTRYDWIRFLLVDVEGTPVEVEGVNGNGGEPPTFDFEVDVWGI